jgi:hypothetical protein
VIVLIAGMPRSGSTFSFNVARSVLQARGSTYQESGEDILGAVHRSNGADHVLIKSHALKQPSMELAKAGAARIVITIRRIEDALASWINTFETLRETTAIGFMRAWLQMFGELRNQALIIRYEQIDHRPWLAARRIARTICPKVGPMEVLGIAHRLDKAAVKDQTDRMQTGDGVMDAGWSYWNTETFFHRRHVSDIISRAAEERLSPETLARIQDALADDLSAIGLEAAQVLSRPTPIGR